MKCMLYRSSISSCLHSKASTRAKIDIEVRAAQGLVLLQSARRHAGARFPLTGGSRIVRSLLCPFNVNMLSRSK